MMRRREFLGTTTAAASLPLLPRGAGAQAKPNQIVLMTWGGLWGDLQKQAIDAGFEKTHGVKVAHDHGAGPVERITKLKVNLNNQVFDIINLHDGLFPLAVKQGVLEPLNRDSPNLPNLKDVNPAMIYSHWVANLFSAIGITYNRKVKNPPTSWADLWRPEFKGRIVLPEVIHSIGLYIVPVGAMAAGKKPNDLEAGFDMLKRMSDLKPILAKDTDTIMSALTTEEALVGLLFKSQTFTIQAKGANVEWAYPKEGAIEISWGYGVAKNTKNREWAERWINEANSPAGQFTISKIFNYPGSNPKMLGLATPEERKRLEFSPEELKNLVKLDHDFMADNRPSMTERWNRIMAG